MSNDALFVKIPLKYLYSIHCMKKSDIQRVYLFKDFIF